MANKMTIDDLQDMISKEVKEILEESKSTQAEIIKEAVKDEARAAILDPEMTEKVIEALKDKAGKEFSPEVKEEKEFKSFGDYLCFVKGATFGAEGIRNDPRAKKYHAKTAGHMEETTDYQGGYLVPDEFKSTLLSVGLEDVIVRNNGPTIIPMKRDSVKIPYINDTTHASTVWGGVAPTWKEERGTKSATKPVFGLVQLQPWKICGLIYASDELLADSAIALDPLIRRLFGAAVNWFEDTAFISGSGTGQPLGILNAPCLVSQAKESNQGAATLTWTDIVEMYSRLIPTSHKRAVWVAHPSLFPEIARMSQSVGTGGTGVFIGEGEGKNAPPVTILGRPLYFSEHCEAPGTKGDIYLTDWSYYLIGDRQDVTIDVSAHTAFTTDELCWRFVKRVDGQPWMSSALTPEHGGSTTTRSAFVTLADRA